MVFIWLTNTINWMLSEYHLACVYIYRERERVSLMVSCDSLHLCFFPPALLLSANSFWVSIWMDLQIGILFFFKAISENCNFYSVTTHIYRVTIFFPPRQKKKKINSSKRDKNYFFKSASFFVSFYHVWQNQQRLLILVTFNVPW